MDLAEYDFIANGLTATAVMMCPSCSADLAADAMFCAECGYRMRGRRSLVGVTIGDRYRVDARIAAGGFGTIYRGIDIVSGREAALKVLHADLAADPNLAARFRREGTTQSSLRNPHTVQTFGVGEAGDGTLFIAMELLRGESLHERFRVCGPLAWRSVLRIMRGVCSSLAEAHALGIVHRDLKPANIHLEAEPVPDFVKVLDFGIAKLMSGSALDDAGELTRVGTAVGTLDYMAPEQLVGGECDGRTDIYTLGVVAYEMITGQRPFQDATGPTSLITAVFTRQPVLPSQLMPDAPVELDAILMRCLARDTAERFANVQELDAAIGQLLAVTDEPTTAWTSPTHRVTVSEPEITLRDAVPMDAMTTVHRSSGPRLATTVAEEHTQREMTFSEAATWITPSPPPLVAPPPRPSPVPRPVLDPRTMVWPPVLPSEPVAHVPQPEQMAVGTAIDGRRWQDGRLRRAILLFSVLLLFALGLGIAIAYAP